MVHYRDQQFLDLRRPPWEALQDVRLIPLLGRTGMTRTLVFSAYSSPQTVQTRPSRTAPWYQVWSLMIFGSLWWALRFDLPEQVTQAAEWYFKGEDTETIDEGDTEEPDNPQEEENILIPRGAGKRKSSGNREHPQTSTCRVGSATSTGLCSLCGAADYCNAAACRAQTMCSHHLLQNG